ncbi:MAG: Ig-like domain-containing protein, partial [Myxococcales bacterium]
TRAGPKTVTARIRVDEALLELPQHPTVTFVPSAAAKLVFAIPPSAAQAGVALEPAVQVQVQDAHGNVVTGDAADVVLELGGGAEGARLGGTTRRATVAGVAKFDDLKIDRAAKGYTLTASAGALEKVTSAPFDVTVGAPARLRFEVQPSDAVAGAPLTPAVELVLEDAEGNRVESANTAVTVALAENPGGATLGGTVRVAAVAGVVRLGDLFLDKAASGYRLAATAPGYAGATSAAFDVSPATPARTSTSLTAAPLTLVANGVETTSLEARVHDAFGNPVPGVTVTFSASGSGNRFTPAQASGTTGRDGTVQAALASSTAESKVLTANVGGLFDAQTTVQFVPGALDATTSTFTAAPASVVADGVASSTLTFVARDAFGNAIAGVPVALSSSGTGDTFTPASGATDGSGTFIATVASTRAELKTLTATTPGRSLTAQVTFTAGVPV